MTRPGGKATRRASARREPKRTITVLCEGEQTETDYLTQLRRLHRKAAVDVDPDGAGCAPLTMVRKAKELLPRTKGKNRSIDEIWCIFDVDDHPNLEQAIQEARDVGINVAVSNPCFELWIWLHHDDQTAHIHRDVIQKKCTDAKLVDRKKLLPGTVKHAAAASHRARLLDEKHSGDQSPPRSNPSSGMRALIDPILGSDD